MPSRAVLLPVTTPTTSGDPADGALWVAGFTAPTFGEYDTFEDDDEIFTTPILAEVSLGDTAVEATPIACHDLALPISVVSTAAVCAASYDAGHDNDVDLKDAASFQRCFSGAGVASAISGCEAFDGDCDHDVDLDDWPRLANDMTLSEP